MSMKFLSRGLLLAMTVPALLTAGCGATGSGQAMKGAASPASPTGTDTGMYESPMPGDSGTASPTGTAGAMTSPRAVVEQFYKALDEGEAQKAAKMFTSDGVAAVQGKDTAEGMQALTDVFEDAKVEGTPNIEESEAMGKAAFVSATVDSTRGFFLLANEGGSWKIDRYMSNSSSD
ncbi:hypothetical protein OUY22_36345 [Nonomuraea sp. MCN248]|uniref:Nuclear transport factor 2 family protein n=1 Tax=Nonomuraea corallina TaxID=2989783 RepID=A0ABT4SNU4_9ACTN|nr:hypothetical protein [Nonomuraea corallina]MDA0638912.1 hypothetical protein [Nonomuraea corallina]